MWNDEKVSILKQLWAEGHSASKIGERLEMSRNAVSGKVDRLKLPTRQTTNSFLPPKKAPRARRRQPRFETPPPIMPRLAPTPPTAPIDSHKVQFFDLRNHHCRYPLWTASTPKADKFYCGSPQANMLKGQEYCPFHRRIVYSNLAAG